MAKSSLTAVAQRAVGFVAVIVSLRLVHASYPIDVADQFLQLNVVLIVFQFLDFGIGNAFVNEFSARPRREDTAPLLARFFFLTVLLSIFGGAISAISLILLDAEVFLGFAAFLWLSVALSLVTKYFIATERVHYMNLILTGMPSVSLFCVVLCCVTQAPPGILFASGTFAFFVSLSIGLLATPALRNGLRLAIKLRNLERSALVAISHGFVWLVYQAMMFAGVNVDYIIGRTLLGQPEDFVFGGLLRVAFGLTLVSIISVPIWPWIARSLAHDRNDVLRRKLVLSLVAFISGSAAAGGLSLVVLYFSADWLIGEDVTLSARELLVIAAFVTAYNLWFGVSSLITSRDLIFGTVVGCLIVFAAATVIKLSLGSSAEYVSLIVTTTAMLFVWNGYGVLRLWWILIHRKEVQQ